MKYGKSALHFGKILYYKLHVVVVLCVCVWLWIGATVHTSLYAWQGKKKRVGVNTPRQFSSRIHFILEAEVETEQHLVLFDIGSKQHTVNTRIKQFTLLLQ